MVVGLRRASAENALRRAAASASASASSRAARTSRAPCSRAIAAIRSASSATAAGWPSVSISSTAAQSVGRPTWANSSTQPAVIRSRNSSVHGMIRAAMIAETVSAASSIRSYSASIVRRAGGRGTSLQQHLGDDAERALGADEQVLHRVAGDVLDARAAEARDPPVRQHDLERHHVVARDAVLQPAQAAGVLGDVAADRADPHRAGIRRIEQAVPRGGFVDREGHDARLRPHREVAWIDVDDRVHLRETEDEAARSGHAPSAQAGTGTTRHDRQGTRGGELHASGDLVRRPRKNDGAWYLPQCRRPVEAVGDDVFRLVSTALAPRMLTRPSVTAADRAMGGL